jgi:hypothetical protein
MHNSNAFLQHGKTTNMWLPSVDDKLKYYHHLTTNFKASQ